jgi:hypothetical protein
MSDELVAQRPGIHLNVIDRSTVRKLVEGDNAYLRRAASEGRNVHQVSLDRSDQVQAYMAGLSETDLALFIKLYEEEMHAVTQAMLQETAEINAQTAQRNINNAQSASNISTWISLIVFFIVLISFIKMMK